MSKSSEATPSHHKEVISKPEAFTKNESEEQQKCLQKMLRDLFSPSNSKTPAGQFKSVDVLLDDRTSEKPSLKIHLSKNVNSDTKDDIKTHIDKKEKHNERHQELDSLPHCFIRKKDGTIVEREYTPQPPAK